MRATSAAGPRCLVALRFAQRAGSMPHSNAVDARLRREPLHLSLEFAHRHRADNRGRHRHVTSSVRHEHEQPRPSPLKIWGSVTRLTIVVGRRSIADLVAPDRRRGRPRASLKLLSAAFAGRRLALQVEMETRAVTCRFH
jgi:hypothetical protein